MSSKKHESTTDLSIWGNGVCCPADLWKVIRMPDSPRVMTTGRCFCSFFFAPRSVGQSVPQRGKMDDVYLPKKMSNRIHLIIKNLLPHLHYNNRGFLPTKDFERENILRKGIMMETNSLCRGRKKYLHEKRTGKHRLCCLDFFLREKGRERVCLTKGSNLQVVSLGGGATKFLLFI